MYVYDVIYNFARMDDAEPYDTQQKGSLETQTREIGYKREKWFHKRDQVARSR